MGTQSYSALAQWDCTAHDLTTAEMEQARGLLQIREHLFPLTCVDPQAAQ